MFDNKLFYCIFNKIKASLVQPNHIQCIIVSCKFIINNVIWSTNYICVLSDVILWSVAEELFHWSCITNLSMLLCLNSSDTWDDSQHAQSWKRKRQHSDLSSTPFPPCSLAPCERKLCSLCFLAPWLGA